MRPGGRVFPRIESKAVPSCGRHRPGRLHIDYTEVLRRIAGRRLEGGVGDNRSQPLADSEWGCEEKTLPAELSQPGCHGRVAVGKIGDEPALDLFVIPVAVEARRPNRQSQVSRLFQEPVKLEGGHGHNRGGHVQLDALIEEHGFSWRFAPSYFMAIPTTALAFGTIACGWVILGAFRNQSPEATPMRSAPSRKAGDFNSCINASIGGPPLCKDSPFAGAGLKPAPASHE